jgi:hypothetical protein
MIFEFIMAVLLLLIGTLAILYVVGFVVGFIETMKGE